MEDERRAILTLVAEGALTPEEGASRLSEIERAAAPAQAASTPAVNPSSIRKVRISRQAGPARVIGDPSVREAVVEGPHEARLEGDSIVIESGPERDLRTFSFHLGGATALNLGLGDRTLIVRSLRVQGVRGPISGQVQAGSAHVDDFASPLNLDVQAGSLHARGRLDAGSSRLTCHAGSVHVHLVRGSDVRISGRSTLGKVRLPDTQGWVIGEGGRQATIGAGTATLDIENSMGSVKVSSDQ